MIQSIRTTLANLLRRLADALDPPPVWPTVRPKSHGGKGEERAR
jgi:hypothetical protein